MECKDALDNRPLRQGDVFRWLPMHHEAPWRMHGIVVTADCDLAKNKTNGLVSYVPLLPLKDYLWLFWMPSRFRPIRDKAAKELADRLTKTIIRISGKEINPLAPRSALDWLERSTNEEIAIDLGLSDPGQIKDIFNCCEKARKLQSMLNKERPDMRLLTECIDFKEPRSDAPANRLKEDIRSHISSLPGDVFYISSLTENDSTAHVAMLRYISQCSLGEIGVNMEDIRANNAHAKRIARLGLPYLHSMTQNLGKVFSDIGLPDTYRESLRACPEQLGLTS